MKVSAWKIDGHTSTICEENSKSSPSAGKYNPLSAILSRHLLRMKFTTLFITISALAATTIASATLPPTLPSYTNMRMNTASQRPAIAKFKTTSTLARSIPESVTYNHAALNYNSNAIRDASTVAAKAKSTTHRRVQRVAHATEHLQQGTTRSAPWTKDTRVEKKTKNSSGEPRRRVTQRRQRREPRILGERQ